ncbi:P-type ATPase (P-ATPase) Superfamily, partial [Phytophthora palmivora]
MVVSEDHHELLPLVRGVQDGVCVPATEDVPSVTSSQRRDDEDRVVFLVVPGLADEDHEAAVQIEAALKRSALGVRSVQLDLLEKLARIELTCRADEAMEAALADELRRATSAQLVAYPVWQHRERIVRLRVDGMRCMTNCGRQVIRALEQIPGVLHIHVDSKSKTAEVALAKGCTATEVDLIKYIRAANPRFDASIAKEKKVRTNSIPGA